MLTKQVQRRSKARIRADNIWKNYRISVETYDALSSKQGGICAVCLTPPNGRPLTIDHCHITGVVRGLLCGNCNAGLGFFRDNPDLLSRAIQYLAR